ncbi:uncharacterized protein LACBIDRAFT_143239, partial [Laccaria bicolor S238N-H82]
VLRGLTWIQWAQFFVGWLAWTCDAIDFFSVSLSIDRLERQFNRSARDITTSITLTLLFRSVGAIVFGIFSDRYGRKWPLVCNLLLISSLELCVGFVQTFKQFLALRSLFGVGMGGIWGLAASTALENLPIEARGVASGVLQQGYACGYLIAALVSLFIVPHATQGWRVMFWTACGISFTTACLRALLPESEYVLRAREVERYGGTDTSKKTKAFIKDVKEMLKQHWALCIYAVLLMAGFNFLSHGSQDLYPTYLETTKGFTPHDAIIATIFGNLVSSPGGITAGIISQRIGRRLTMILMVLLAGVFIPLWILPNTFVMLSAGAFCLQFGVQGAWGVIPIQLAEMSPPAFRATFPGVAYQLGNVSSTNLNDGKKIIVPDYAKVQGIFIGAVAAFVVFITIIGPEYD